MTKTPQDQPARDRIECDLDTSMLVEAGAGSGKTTALVGRMLALVERGIPVEQIAAVTFTRKAASELRERFENKLEERAASVADADVRDRLRVARDHLGRAFLGTIHSFAARLLREHPLEAGLDPDFAEVPEEEWPAIRAEFWRSWLERSRLEDDPALETLRRLNVDPRELFDAFSLRAGYPDVAFPAPEEPLPDAGPCRCELEALMDRARRLMPKQRPESGWDQAQLMFLRLERLRRTPDWHSVARFADALLDKAEPEFKPTCWGERKTVRKGMQLRDVSEVHALKADLLDFQRLTAIPLIRSWRAHRYAPVMRFIERAVEGFAAQRLSRGTLGFEDLLQLAARLLRDSPGARKDLGGRYRRLLVDEFQDTDPIQAEVCFLLASDPEQGNRWTSVTPRPGALFVVGDPKQSIYRFRRADITTYELVKRCILRTGAVLQLTQNFRSVKPVADLVNGHFPGAFPESASAIQAALAPLITDLGAEEGDGVFQYAVRPKENNKEQVIGTCAAQVASLIGERLKSERYEPSDFLVLTTGKDALASYASALASRNIPVSVTGAGLTAGHELEELLVLLRAIADPTNEVLVVAALEGLFAGLVPEQLLDARRAGLRFDLTGAPPDTSTPAGAALARLHEWWLDSQRLPPDALLEQIVDGTGLMPHTASGELGDNAAGAIAEVIAVARRAAMDGRSSLGDVMRRIEAAVASSDSEASLRPELADAVRVLNLHKAKGLEARVVFLAAPVKMWDPKPDVHVSREADGTATGVMLVEADKRILAAPLTWEEQRTREVSFLDAEFDRFLYVAVTRAKRELWISRLEFEQKNGKAPDKSLWARLSNSPAKPIRKSELGISTPPGRRHMERSAAEIVAASGRASERRTAAAAPRWTTNTVTRLAREDAAEAEELKLSRSSGLGRSWGSAVHECLEAMGRGRWGLGLTGFANAVAKKYELSEFETTRLLFLLYSHTGSPEWASVIRDGAEGQVELQVAMMEEGADGVPRLVEGVIDAVTLVNDEWSVMDWKTDSPGDESWEQRSVRYQRQVDTYARMLRTLTGRPATGRVVRLQADGG